MAASMNPTLSTVTPSAFSCTAPKQEFFPTSTVSFSGGSPSAPAATVTARRFQDPKFPDRVLHLSCSNGLPFHKSHNNSIFFPDAPDPVEPCLFSSPWSPSFIDYPLLNSLPILPPNYIFPSTEEEDINFEPYSTYSNPKCPCLEHDYEEGDYPLAFLPPVGFDLDDGLFPPELFSLLPPPPAPLEGHFYGETPAEGTKFSNGCGGEGRTVSAQSIAARERRRKITMKTQELGKLVPGGSKKNTAEMLGAAFKYVSFLQAQLRILQFASSLHQEMQEEAEEAAMEELRTLLASETVQEKLYGQGKCLVLEHSVHLLQKHRAYSLPPSDPFVSDLLKQILSSGNS